MMLRKVIPQVLFGTPYDPVWMTEYLAACNALGPYGYEWLFFMDPALSPYRSLPHVDIIPMTLAEYDALVARTLGVTIHNVLVGLQESPPMSGQPRDLAARWPKKLMSCYYPFYGLIFKDYLRGADWWGHTNWDIVFGRLDRWFTDERLSTCDIFSDQADAINGIWTLYRNTPDVNRLCLEIPDWRTKLAYPGPDNPYVLDEHEMTLLVPRAAREGRVRFAYSTPYWHRHDGFVGHNPPQLRWEAGGGLTDMVLNKEIPFFHFRLTKTWPRTLTRRGPAPIIFDGVRTTPPHRHV